MCSKANRVLGMIGRIVVFKKVMTRLYKSLVRPHLEYCVSVWSPHYVNDRERLETVPGLRGLEYRERLERLKRMTLEERRNRSDMVEMFKNLKRTVRHFMEFFLPPGQFGKNKRTLEEVDKGKLQIGCQKTLLFSKSGEPMEWAQ